MLLVPCLVVGRFFCIEADLSCWLNIGENFSILALLPMFGCALTGGYRQRGHRDVADAGHGASCFSTCSRMPSEWDLFRILIQ